MTGRQPDNRPLTAARLDATLAVVLVGYRFVAAVWLTVLAGLAIANDEPRLAVVWAAIAAAWVGAVATGVAVRLQPRVLLGWPWLIADLALGLFVLAAPFLDGDTTAVNFSGGYPLSSVLLWTYVWGWRGGALSVAAAVALILGAGDYSANGKITASTVYVVGAAVVAWGLEVLRRNEGARIAAEEALAAERAERVRSDERAEMAAHLHDSVLQTLALIQRRAADAGEVTTLARRQERELRSWLYGERAAAAESLAAAVAVVAAEVEESYPITVDVVTVGDRSLDDRGAALVAATREALINAAKWSGATEVSVYAEAGAGGLAVFVRDRGAGFDPAGVDGSRRGIADSIVGRMERHGGSAAIRSAPGQGTEVEMRMEQG